MEYLYEKLTAYGNSDYYAFHMQMCIRDREMVTPVAMEPMLGYHPCSTGLLTSRREPAVGQCQTGSLTGAVASERVSEATKGSLRMDGNHSKSAKACLLYTSRCV